MNHWHHRFGSCSPGVSAGAEAAETAEGVVAGLDFDIAEAVVVVAFGPEETDLAY